MLMEELTEEALRDARLQETHISAMSRAEAASDPPVPRISRIEVTGCGAEISITAADAATITWKTDDGTVATGDTVDLRTLI